MSWSMSKQAWINRLRMEMIAGHGTAGTATRVSTDTFAAASPMISTARTKAN